jgi:hypothetical protein
MGKACSTHREDWTPYRALVGKPEGKRLQERQRHRWEGNTEMDLKQQNERVWTGFIWFTRATSKHNKQLLGCIKCWEFLK